MRMGCCRRWDSACLAKPQWEYKIANPFTPLTQVITFLLSQHDLTVKSKCMWKNSMTFHFSRSLTSKASFTRLSFCRYLFSFPFPSLLVKSVHYQRNINIHFSFRYGACSSQLSRNRKEERVWSAYSGGHLALFELHPLLFLSPIFSYILFLSPSLLLLSLRFSPLPFNSSREQGGQGRKSINSNWCWAIIGYLCS